MGISIQYTIEIPIKPLSINEVSNGSHWQGSAERKVWRTAMKLKTRILNYQFEGLVDIEVRRLAVKRLPDHVSPALAVKGAVDGMKDGGLIVDDSPKYVRNLVFLQPVKADRDALVFFIRQVEP